MNQHFGPLTHLRVIELAGLAPAPYCGLILKQFGADVVQVSRTGTQPEDPAGLALGKRNVAVDMKSPAGIEIIKRMLKHADVLIDPFRPGVLEKLGLDPQMLLEKVNPRLIVARVTGWGQTGPYAQAAGHDTNYIALSGALSLFARSERDAPLPPINLLGDFAGGGMLAALGILVALYERSKSGQGQVVDAAMIDGASHLATFIWRMRANGVWSDKPGTNVLDTAAPFYDTYVCSDGKFLSVGAIEPQFYQLLLRGLGLEGEGDMPAHQFNRAMWPDNKRVIAGRIAMKPRDHWAHVFRPDGPLRDACVAPVLTLAEAVEHPHNKARKSFLSGPSGKPADVVPIPAPRLSRTPAVHHSYYSVPAPGENTRTVMLMYGFTNQEVEQYSKDGVVLLEERPLGKL